jgi:hypothetical protein
MRLVDFLDKGASLNPAAPCLVTDEHMMSYAVVQDLSYVIASALVASGVEPGTSVAIL